MKSLLRSIFDPEGEELWRCKNCGYHIVDTELAFVFNPAIFLEHYVPGLPRIERNKCAWSDPNQRPKLIGYSVSGYHELPYVSDNHARRASEAAREAIGTNDKFGCRDGAGCKIHYGVEEES